ncbi:unnamed protein product [[Candida] boidinii]|uniref:Unnamed protein product n=1 Tax=Candida boidinii TaxID=5477 RepID=A0ACB5TPJ0_CANBO|nr:unnamed protein product [[Candida] boidinii]
MQEHKGITQALALATFVQGCGEKRQGRQKVTKLKLKHFWGEKQRESQRRHLRLLGHAVTSQLTVASWRGIPALGVVSYCCPIRWCSTSDSCARAQPGTEFSKQEPNKSQTRAKQERNKRETREKQERNKKQGPRLLHTTDAGERKRSKRSYHAGTHAKLFTT